MSNNDPWVTDFILAVNQQTSMWPDFQMGTDPDRDLALHRINQGATHPVWYVYPEAGYSPDYWEEFRQRAESAGRQVYVQHAVVLSETVFGLAALEDYSIPAAWIMTVTL